MLEAPCARARSNGKLTPVHLRLVEELSTACSCCSTRCVDYLPSPADRPPVDGHRAQDQGRRSERKPDAERAVRRPGLQDRHRADRRPGVPAHLLGRTAAQGRGAEHRSTSKPERVARIFRMMGDRRDRLDVAGPGEIVAVVGLKNTLHGQHAVRRRTSR